MAHLSKEQKKQIEVIQERTRKITQSKDKASDYLKKSGILDFVKKATAKAGSNGNASQRNPEE